MSVNKDIEQILMKVQKPGRYVGGELNSVIKDKEKVDVRFAFCFPDVYEVGMSHLGMKILYSLINERENYWCERVFAPELDMEEQMFLRKIPLYALESKDPLREFDIIGFTLQYELCYTTVLNMLHMAGIPVRSADRDDSYPLVVAGGPCVCNPEPMADFIDVLLTFFSWEKGKKICWSLSICMSSQSGRKYPNKNFCRKLAISKGPMYPAFMMSRTMKMAPSRR